QIDGLLSAVLATPSTPLEAQSFSDLEFSLAATTNNAPSAYAAPKSPSPATTVAEDNQGPCTVFSMPESEVDRWLSREQITGNFRFVQCGGKKKRVHGWYWKYVCHCYGRPEVKVRPKKGTKRVRVGRISKASRSSKKVGCPCAAYITCSHDGMATIRYYPMHRGHELTEPTAQKHGRKDMRAFSPEASPTLTVTGDEPEKSSADIQQQLMALPGTPVQEKPVLEKPVLAKLAQEKMPAEISGLVPMAGVQVAPVRPAAGVEQWMALWKTLGHLPFVETAPFSFGFVRAQALAQIPSKDDHVSSLVLSLERAMGTNLNGYPLYTLLVLNTETNSSEHLAYLVTADMSHGALQRWLEQLRLALRLRPQTCLLDPDDIAGHTAINLVFGSECLVLWALDRMRSWWLVDALPVHTHARALNYSNGRLVEEVIWALLTLAIEGDPYDRRVKTHFRSTALFYLAAAAASLCMHALAVKHEDFKTCEQAAFCRRQRAFAELALKQPSSASSYSVLDSTVKLDGHRLVAQVQSREAKVPLQLEVTFMESGTVRVRVQEVDPLRPRYDDTQKHVLRDQGQKLPYAKAESLAMTSATVDGRVQHTVKYVDGGFSVRLTEKPWALEYLQQGKAAIQLNTKGFFNFEHQREKTDVDDVDGGWEETFKSWTDSKPRGPES
ncbi:glucosidase II, partial [Linderina macrospora]